MENQELNKKKGSKKRILLIILIAILLFLIVGVVLFFTVPSLFKGGPVSAPGDSTIFENEIAPDEIIFDVDGESIQMSEFCYYLYDTLGKMESKFMTSELDFSIDMGEGMALGEYVMKNSVDGVRFSRAVERLAKELNLDRTKVETEVDEYLATTTKDSFMGDQAAFSEQLALMGTTLKSFRQILICQRLGSQVFEHYYGETGKEKVDPAEYYERFATFSNILLLTTKSGTDVQTGQEAQLPLTEEEIAQKRTLADAILEQLKSGSDFYKLLNQYGEDIGVKSENSPKQNYTFQKNEMNYELSKTVFATEPGKYSEIVKASYGFYIVYRLPLDKEAVDEAVKTPAFRYALFNEMLEESSKEDNFTPSLLFQNARLTDWYKEYKAKNY